MPVAFAYFTFAQMCLLGAAATFGVKWQLEAMRQPAPEKPRLKVIVGDRLIGVRGSSFRESWKQWAS